MTDGESVLEVEFGDDEFHAVELLANSLGVDIEDLGHDIIPKYAKMTHGNPRYDFFDR